MDYQVFARKYRPRTFDDVLGQDHVVRTLKNAITQNRLAHAYLFVGPRGTGKTSTSRIFAKALNCSRGPRIDFDPDEDICVEIAEGRSLDVLEIDGASNNGVDHIRDLRDNVHYAPARGQFRIYYIDEVHMLSGAAFNALLKTLEEPPPHVKFIFATTEAHKILPTILSRCQRFDLRRIPTPVISQHLMHIADLESLTLEPMAAHAIATGADGGMRDAQSMLDQLVAFSGSHVREQDVLDVFGFTSHLTVSDLSGAILSGRTGHALGAIYTQAESGKDLSRLLADLIFHFRNLLVHKVDSEIAMRDLPTEMAQSLAGQAEIVSSDKLLLLIDQFAEVESSMKWALNKRLYFEIGIIRAGQILGEASLNDVIIQLRKALDGSPVLGNFAPSPRPEPPLAIPGHQSAASTPEPPRMSMRDALKASLEASQTSSPLASLATTPEPAPWEPEPPVSSASGTSSANYIIDETFWPLVREAFSARFPLQGGYAREASFIGVQGRHFVLGFPEAHRMAGANLERPNSKGVLESIIEELSGQRLVLKIEVNSDIAIAPAPEITSLGPVESSALPLNSEKPKEREKAGAKAAEVQELGVRMEAEFRNDPLISEAMKLFEAKLAK